MIAWAFLLRLTVAALAVWASLVVAQTPDTLGVKRYAGLTITGQVGRGYHIEYTTSLAEPITWIPLDYLVIPCSPYLYIDTGLPASERRFYRARESTVLLGAEMVYIPAGRFMMGSPEREAERYSNETQHQVALTRGFWMGKYEVTQGEYLAVMGTNPSHFDNGAQPYPPGNGGVVMNELRHPVEMVSWSDATNYCGKLTQLELELGRTPARWQYRLPTEGEWEYACRGGIKTACNYGPALSQAMANFWTLYEYDSGMGTIITTKTPLGRTTLVGSYPANAFGLYDMHGNVAEWCLDWLGNYPDLVATDPVGPTTGSYRVARGGSYGDFGRACRSANRTDNSSPGTRLSRVGFRVVLAPGQ